MANKMKILKGAGVNADTLEIIVTNKENERIFYKKYYYGTDISYDKRFADEKRKPLDIDVVRDKALEFDVKLSDIEIGEGRNLFRESLEKGM